METNTPTSSTAAAPAATSTPSASSSPAATSTPAATTSTPAAASTSSESSSASTSQPAAISADDTRSVKQILADTMSAAAAERDKVADPQQTTTTQETQQTEGDPAAETTTGETTEEEKPAAETQTSTEDDESFFEQFEQPTGAKDLAAKLTANAAVNAALEADPSLKGELFANARLAAQAAAYKEVFASPEEARVASEAHAAFGNIRNFMVNVQDGDNTSVQAAINSLLEASTLRDDEGNILKDANGSPQTDGTVGRLFKNAFRLRMEGLEAEAKKSGDDTLQAAIDTVMESIGLRASSSSNEDEMSEEMRQQRHELDRQRQELDERKASERNERIQQHDTSVNTQIDGVLDSTLNRILDRATGLTAFSRSKVDGDIRTGLMKMVQNSPTFQTELDGIERMPYGPNRAKAHVALATRYINQYLARVAQPILTEAGATIQKKGAEQAAKQAAREEAARSESRGSLGQTRPAQQPQLTEAQMMAKVESDLQAKLGRAPNTTELLAESMRQRSSQM